MGLCRAALALGFVVGLSRLAPAYQLSNGYWQLAGSGGEITTLRCDPGGGGRYGDSILISLFAGEVPIRQAQAVEAAPGTLLVRGVRFARAAAGFRVPDRDRSVRLEPGQTLAQTFETPRDGLVKVGAAFPTWYATDSGMTLTLRREAPDGEVIASQTYTRVGDNSWQYLAFPPQPKGRYALVVSDPVGTIGLWTKSGDPYPKGQVLRDGESLVGYDAQFEYLCADVESGDFAVELDGPTLRLTPQAVKNREGLRFRLVTPWTRDGFAAPDYSDVIFTRFISDAGQYVPVEQLKRRPRMDFTMPIKDWLHITGARGLDLRLRNVAASLEWTMTADQMTLGLGRTLEVAVLPHTDWVPDFYPRFFSSDAELDGDLNRFLWERAFSWPLSPGSPDWMEWLGRSRDWADLPGYLARERAHLLRYKMEPNGYVYTWGDRIMWPFPDNAKYDARHYTTNAMFILGCCRYYAWTKDREFVERNLDRLRKAMDYQLGELRGETGLLVMLSPDHDGTSAGVHSNYWDDIPFGYKSAYANIYFYASLLAMADLENALDNVHRAGRLRRLARRVRANYSKEFWDDGAGRFIGCVDRTGARHDYGFTYVNMEAMAYGLATPEQARRIYHWMETEPTHSGRADTYSAYRFAPRCTTLDCSGWWYLNGTAEIPSQPWGKHLENGGAILYTSHYDLIARARLIGANDAYRRLQEILARYREPDRLCGGAPLYHGEHNGWEVGTDVPFPESGLAPAAFLYAFLGIEADCEGLKIRPNLPDALEFAGVRNLCYRELCLEVRVTHDAVRLACREPGYQFEIERRLEPGATFVFTAPPAPVRGFPPRQSGSRWRAEWVWYPGKSSQPDFAFVARKAFHLDEKPRNALIWIAADNEYALFVNGDPVGSGHDWSRADRYEVQRYLHAGENIIAVRARNADGPGGLLAQLEMTDPAARVATDGSWRVATEEEPGWMQPGFDDTGWPGAESLGAPPVDPWSEIAPEPEYAREVQVQ